MSRFKTPEFKTPETRSPAAAQSTPSAAPSALTRRQSLGGMGAAALSLSGWAGLSAPSAALAQAGPSALERIRTRGRLTVGLYNDMPPFHVDGKGIDVELARALAQALGLELAMMPFNADENMNDDLRNLVWRGHYLGFGPADVLLHVPVDRPLMQNTPQVEIFAPYYRERVMIARDLQRVPKMDSMADFAGHKIAVPGLTLAGWLLIGADNGAYREQLNTRLKDGTLAAQSLLKGEVAGAAGLASELQATLGNNPRYAIEALPLPRGREGWAVGMAVKKDAMDLAHALQAAVNGLVQSGEMQAIFTRAQVRWAKP